MFVPLVIRHFRAATTQGTINAESIQELRLSLVQIVEDLLVAEGSALQVTTEYLNGQEVLSSDTLDAFSKQLRFAEESLVQTSIPDGEGTRAARQRHGLE